MAMTVKRMIEALQTIENIFLEVEVYSTESTTKLCEIDHIKRINKKVLIFTKGDTNDRRIS
jgi:hypothetical protein